MAITLRPDETSRLAPISIFKGDKDDSAPQRLPGA